MNIYEKHCGKLSAYGLKYTRVLANMCKASVNGDQEMALFSAQFGDKL